MLIHQYSNATNLNRLLYGQHDQLPSDYEGILEYLTLDVNQFYKDYFDIDSADTDGLNNWGRILNFSRSAVVADDYQVFGFDGAQDPTNKHPDLNNDYPQNFNHGTFYGGQTKIVSLTNIQYRLLLKFRYKILNTNGSLASINNIMNSYFQMRDATHKVRVTENGIMSLLFEFNFYVEDFEFYTFNQRLFMPIPLGVSYTLSYNVPF